MLGLGFRFRFYLALALGVRVHSVKVWYTETTNGGEVEAAAGRQPSS